MRHLALLLSLSALTACNLQDPLPPLDASEDDMGPSDMASDTGPDLPQDMAGEEMCVPRTCEDFVDGACGPQSDGCGGDLDCGPCGCDPMDVAGTCDSLPCQTAIGCGHAGECQYEPVMCSGLACVCPAGQDCTQDPVRCTDACPAVACDPSPMMVDGEVQYQNTCVDVEPAACKPDGVVCGGGTCDGADMCVANECGACGLGRWNCGGAAPVCEPLELGGIDPDDVNCVDTAVDSTFLYVDYDNGDADPSGGSRARPLSSLSLAVMVSMTRSADAIVIAGSPRIEDVQFWTRSLSLYGGFQNKEGVWARDPTQRPVISSSSFEADGSHIGFQLLSNAASGVVLSGLRFEGRDTDPSNVAASSVALSVLGANGVTLHDLELAAGTPSPGLTGSPGAPGALGQRGGSGQSSNGGRAGTNRMCPNANGGDGGNGGAFGMLGERGKTSPAGIRGGNGGSSGTRGGDGETASVNFQVIHGMPGVFTSELRPSSLVWTPTGAGEPGRKGSDGLGGGGGGGGGGRIGGLGGGGGGGGAGGCGGEAGEGGGPGGGSIALIVVGARGVSVVGGTWAAKAGGRGGDGGAGGAAGKAGESGGPGLSLMGSSGGVGGAGVDGGVGGDGGPGAGGPSYGVLCLDGGDLTFAQNPTITIGAAGEGGRNSVARGADGESLETQGCSP